MPIDQKKISNGVRMILEGLGQDLSKGAVAETPDRVASAFCEIFSGMDERPEELVKTFIEEGDGIPDEERVGAAAETAAQD